MITATTSMTAHSNGQVTNEEFSTEHIASSQQTTNRESTDASDETNDECGSQSPPSSPLQTQATPHSDTTNAQMDDVAVTLHALPNQDSQIDLVRVKPGDASTRSATLSPSLRASSLNLSSIHSLHPQLDLKLNNRFMLMPINDQVRELQTVIRDKQTNRGNFKFYADRLIRLVVEEGLNKLPIEKIDVRTPTGNTFHGIKYSKGNCGVSIVRSGESMEQGLRDCCRSIRIGKILIESDQNNKARALYAKFPRDIAVRKILLLYPIMSTGLAVYESVKVLQNHGVKEDNLILLNLFCSPRAAKMINQTFPKMYVLTSDINQVCPNHFGHRYFGTD